MWRAVPLPITLLERGSRGFSYCMYWNRSADEVQYTVPVGGSLAGNETR